RTTVLLRRAAAGLVREPGLFSGLEGVVEPEAEGEETRIVLPADLSAAAVETWAGRLFPARYDPARVGGFLDDQGVYRHRPHMTVVEVLIARLTELMRG